MTIQLNTNQLLHADHNILVEDWLITLLCIDAAITIINLFSEIPNLIHHNLFKYRLDYLLNPERDRAYMQWKEIAVSTQYVTLVGRQGIVSNTNLFFFDALKCFLETDCLDYRNNLHNLPSSPPPHSRIRECCGCGCCRSPSLSISHFYFCW